MAWTGKEPEGPVLTDKEEKIAQGKALIASGVSQVKAAKVVGVSRGTLQDHYHRWVKSDPATKDRLEGEIIAKAFQIARLAQDRLVTALEGPEKIAVGELNVLYGTATDKLARFRRWDKRSDLNLGDLSAQLGSVMDDVREASFSVVKDDGSTTSVRMERTKGE